MKYKVEFTNDFEKSFKKLDRYTQIMISTWINKHLVDCSNPRVSGKALIGNKKGQWRYRIGDYRLLCHIDDGKLLILTLNIGHRREVYK